MGGECTLSLPSHFDTFVRLHGHSLMAHAKAIAMKAKDAKEKAMKAKRKSSYLDEPIKKIVSDDTTLEVDGGLLYGGSAMQGWRPTMEDQHGHGTLHIGDKKASLVYVFDGHMLII